MYMQSIAVALSITIPETIFHPITSTHFRKLFAIDEIMQMISTLVTKQCNNVTLLCGRTPSKITSNN